MTLTIGARVRVKPECATQFIQPWRDRFQKGREGTVVCAPSKNVPGWNVIWDHGKVKYPREYHMVMRESDLVLVAPAPADFDPKPLLETH